MSVDAIDDFAFLSLRVWGDGEAWAHGGASSFGGRRTRRSGVDGLGVGGIGNGGRWVHECDGGGTELCSGGDDFGGVAEDGGGLGGGRHVVVVWKCCCR